MSSTEQQQPVLADRSINEPASPSKATMAKAGKDSSVYEKDYHRRALQSHLGGAGVENKNSKQTYVSPSDNLVSPCTAKLSNLKNRHFMKAKGQSLFGKSGLSTSSSSTATAAAGAGAGFEDVEPRSSDSKESK